MRYAFTIHQKAAAEAGITNGNVLLVLEIIALANTWATPEIYNGKAYFFTARQMIAKELSLWGFKPDTVYRHMKSLDELGLVDYEKKGKKDLTRLTKKGQKFFGDTMSDSNPDSDENAMSETDPNDYVGNESELDNDSEMNPSKSGNESENNSDLNPTDQYNYKQISNTNDQEKEKASPSRNGLMPKVYEAVANRYLQVRQSMWPTQIEYTKQLTLCHLLASLDLPLETDDQIHTDIVRQIDNAVKAGEYTRSNRKPITSAIEAAFLAVSSDAFEPLQTARKLCVSCQSPHHSFSDDGRCADCL